MGFPRIDPFGLDALLVRFSDRLEDGANRACVAFRAALAADPPEGVAETASSLGSVMVRLDDPAAAAAVEADLRARLDGRDWGAGGPPPRRLWRLPCAFGGADGPQLGEVAHAAGLDARAAVAALAGARLRVLALGFAPGMPYLGILPPEWDLPRQTGLTPEVEPGALVLAVRQMVLFGTRAPTGWRQVARTGFRPFDLDRDAPVALAAGDEVRLWAMPPDEVDARAAEDARRLGGAEVEAVA